jgi:hypothetical protein
MKMKKVILGLVLISATAASAAMVDYVVIDTLTKTYVGGEAHSWEYEGILLFTGLTMSDRLKLGLPVMEENPNYDPNDPNSAEFMEITDPNESIVIKEHIPPYEDTAVIEATVLKRMEKHKTDYEAKLVPEPAELNTITLTGEKFIPAKDE